MILLIEDDADTRQLLALFFGVHQQETLACDSAYRAQEVLKAQVPDAIVLDYHMPQMDGLQLLEQLTSDDRLSHVPIFLVTGDPKVSESTVRQLGAAALYRKGTFEWDSLVQDVIRRAGLAES